MPDLTVKRHRSRKGNGIMKRGYFRILGWLWVGKEVDERESKREGVYEGGKKGKREGKREEGKEKGQLLMKDLVHYKSKSFRNGKLEKNQTGE